MIIVTGAAGFIGSNIVKTLNERGVTDILAVDDLTQGDQFRNLVDCHIADYLDKNEFRRLVLSNGLPHIEAVLHQGACSDTMETNGAYMMDNNYRVSLELLEWCQSTRTRLMYASSAATYGMGPEYRESPSCEAPLNVYGYSKLLFDQIVRRRWDSLQTQVVGLRYFNVYGPREQHKNRMASVAYHQYHQFKNEGCVKLFEGTDGYGHGQQMRDFIHVNDVCEVNMFFLENENKRGIFNCGTGRAQPFNAVSHTVINTLLAQQNLAALSLEEQVEQGLLQYVPFPNALRGKYQSYTQADMTRLREIGYTHSFMTVEQGVSDYMQVMSNKP